MMLLPALALTLACQNPQQAVMNTSEMPPNLYGFQYKDIDGKPVKMDRYKGKVLLIVNTASECGFTPQYKGLQAVYEKYKDKGLVVVGFPANDFGSQEPGSEKEIKTFCESKFGVTFPMSSKVVVKGDDKTALYKWLIERSGRRDEIEWNFAKFIVGRDGHAVTRFTSKSTPESPEVIAAIESALAEKG